MINKELPNIKVHDTTVQQLAFLLPIPEVPGSVHELEPGFPNWDLHGNSEPLYTKSGTVPSTDHVFPVHHSLPSIQHQVPHAVENILSSKLRHKPIVVFSLSPT